MERPTAGHLAFLDLDLSLSEDRNVVIQVHRKDCHTNQYLNFNSHHPFNQRQGTASTLLLRSKALPSTCVLQRAEEKKVFDALQTNGYPRQLLNRTSRALNLKLRHGAAQPQTQAVEPTGHVVLPYVAGTTERVCRVLRNYGIRVAQKPVSTLRNVLVRPKDKTHPYDVAGVVYKTQCSDCDATYVGETGRTLRKRLEEHQRGLRLNQPEKSALAQHALHTNHNIDWSGSEVLEREQGWRRRRWKEAIAIHKHRANLNRNDGLQLPDQYSVIL